MSKKYPLGKCPVCGFNIRLRKSGAIGAHRLYSGHDLIGYCEGVGRQPEITRCNAHASIDRFPFGGGAGCCLPRGHRGPHTEPQFTRTVIRATEETS